MKIRWLKWIRWPWMSVKRHEEILEKMGIFKYSAKLCGKGTGRYVTSEVKDGILTIEEMTARDRKRYLDCQEHRFREISEMGAKVGEIYAFNPITGEIREVEKK
jgi:hypothetical protein